MPVATADDTLAESGVRLLPMGGGSLDRKHDTPGTDRHTCDKGICTRNGLRDLTRLETLTFQRLPVNLIDYYFF